eukprot:jgi/Orpsp1_1/1181770/evm.model.c7180000078520.1
MNINNSLFDHNFVRNYGGSLCFSNIGDLNINITSSVFCNNYAMNGGVIYFNKKLSNNNINNINIADSVFSKNNAKYYGGVIYSNIEALNLSKISNTTFNENHAYAGGILYLNNINNYTFFDVKDKNKNIKFIDNISESHGNEFASGPSVKTLITGKTKEITVRSGEIFPLEYKLIDEFDQIIKDISKYYSNIILKIYNDDENENEKNILYGNTCHFFKGICNLNNFKIYSTQPETLKLKLSLENEDKNINFSNNEELKITIKNCDDNQIKMTFKKNDIYYYCENPKCDENCPYSNHNATAVCIKGPNENVNSAKLNKCQCLPGWEGNNCQTKVIANI